MSDTYSKGDFERLLPLSQGWVWTNLKESSLKLQSGGTPSTKVMEYYSNGTIPFVKIEDMVNSQKYLTSTITKITQAGVKNSAAWIVPKNALLYSMYASYGVPIITKIDVATNQAIIAYLSDDTLINTDFIYYYLLYIKPTLKRNIRGTTQENLNANIVSSLPIVLAPYREQNRIVTKIEELFTQLDAGVASLKKVQAQLKRYRQAVLKTAFEGRLTQGWREKHQTGNKRFLEYVKQNWEKYHKGKKFTKIDSSNLLPLPEGWLWSNFDQISQRVTVGHVGPMKEEYIDRGIPFLRSQNVRTNRFDPEGLKFISPGFHTQIKKSTLFPNDIVVVRSGNVGVSCVIPEFLKEANCSDLVIVKQPYGILPSLGAYYMNSTALRLVNAKKVGVALTHFNTKSMAEMVVPLPPIEEQKFLLSEIERLFSIADEIEQTITTSLRQAKTLRQSILKRAFEGRLVPQDPTDEPASILLERIKAEKARHATEGKKGKTLQPKSPKRKIKNAN